ncbi:MAG: crotonase/enoyl-CoA hydratase family protein [Chloroflexota bacterium]|nr:crotonase/enoyl-CoA hydratase family protein [Chloroflexota bacterium]
MEYTQIQCALAEGILTVTLSRPEQLNALTPVMRMELIDAFDQADNDDEVRVVIVTGAGRAFCAGADVSGGEDAFNFRKRDAEDTLETHRDGAGLIALKIYDMKKPVIAAINGAAVGVGITMTLPMDIRLATDGAQIGFAFTRRGVVPEACSSWFLPRLVGMGKAMEWFLSGKIFPASKALEGGLFNEVLRSDALIPRAMEIAREIVQNTSAISVALSRQFLWKMSGADHPMEAHRIDSKCMYWAGMQADSAEGIRSFLEKRSPEFKMKPSTDMPEFYPWWDERPFELP